MNILIVEDDAEGLLLLERMVQGLEHGSAVSFSDPARALEWCEENVPSLVLVDYLMPTLDGLEFIRRLKTIDGRADVPVIMVTSSDSGYVRQQALELGVNDFIPKPVDRAELAMRVRNVLALDENRRRMLDRATWLAEEVQKATSELRRSEERYVLAARGSNDGLWDWNIATGEVYLSPRWKAILGADEGDIPNTLDGWFSNVVPEDLAGMRAMLDAHLRGETDHFQCEYRMRHKDGTHRWVLTRGEAVFNGTGATRIAGSQTDVTERKRTEEQMLHDAFHDRLTGLPNRALFMDRLGQAIHRARRRRDASYAVMLMDVDRFKVINDSLGHSAGDELLRQWAERLLGLLRPTDTPARLSGDVFTVLLDDVNGVGDAIAAANRIHEASEEPFRVAGTEIFSSMSIGIATGSPRYEHADDLLRDADVAMHRAKAEGANRYRVFEEAMHAGAVERFELESDLRRALQRENELVLYYQPIIRLDSGKIAGFEALVRWRHPKRGLLLPGDFIPIAEEAGLIVPVGDFVVREAYRQLQVWEEQMPEDEAPYLAINLSSRQFRDPAHIASLVRRMGEAGRRRRLQLEITESVLMDNAEQVATILRQMQATGTRISIDDFGTGYSSLSYLHRFPVDILKIDRAFVGLIAEEDSNVGIIRAIIRLGHDLGMSVVAEGVETSRQCQKLRDLDCEYGQGYYFSHPLMSEDAGELLARAPTW